MKTPRFASIGFGILWLAMLALFSGASMENGLLIFVLLAAFIGLKRAYLMRWDQGLPVTVALAYCAGINFGPAGGFLVGAIAAIAQNINTTGMSGNKMVGRIACGSASGFAAGIFFVNISQSAIPVNLPVAVFCSGIAAYIAMLLTHVAARKILAESEEPLAPHLAVSTELAVGVGLAAVLRMAYSYHPADSIILIMPISYLLKQLVEELASSFTLSDHEEHEHLQAEAISALIEAIDARDRYARRHTSNVVRLALSIGRRMNLTEDELKALQTAALFHDIGKLWVPEHILLRPGRLDPDQFAKIQCHPALGQKILDRVRFPWPVGKIIRGHHEWWNGSGYPDKLKGDAIPLGSRILCLADVFDAMTSKRLYRASNTIQETMRYIRDSSGTHFDPSVVKAFEKVVADHDLPDQHKNMIEENTAVVVGPGDDISRTSSEFVAIFEIAQTASTSLDLEKVLPLLAGKINSMISCCTCVIFLREEESDVLEAKIAIGSNAQYLQGARATLGRGQTGIVGQIGQGIISDFDCRELELACPAQPWNKFDDWVELCSAMSVPIATPEGVIGVVNLYHAKKNAFSEEDLRLLTAVGPQIGRAILNALLFKSTTESALTDMVTGLPNARSMFGQLENELDRASHLGKPLSLLCMDLDNFKAINDAFGHQYGDVVLREVGEIFSAQLRDTDLVCRYAGDEFVILLPDTDRDEALRTARRIEETIDAHPPYGSPEDIHIGVSIGVASYPMDGQDAHTLIAKADVAMYAHKKQRKKAA